MAKIQFDKTIYVKDKYGVMRQAFMAGQSVEDYVAHAILRKDEAVNPQDLPEILLSKKEVKPSLHSKPLAKKEEVKPEEKPVEEVKPVEAEPVEEKPAPVVEEVVAEKVAESPAEKPEAKPEKVVKPKAK